MTLNQIVKNYQLYILKTNNGNYQKKKREAVQKVKQELPLIDTIKKK